MPELENKRWEKFAQNKANGMNNPEAYLKADFNIGSRASANSVGWKLAKKPLVAGRIIELQREMTAESAMVSGMDREAVMTLLANNYKSSFKKGQYTAANKSAELMGKEIGMFKDILQLENIDSVLEAKNTDQLRLEMSQACAEIGMRVIDMDDEATRDFIRRNAIRVGMVVVTKEEAEADAVQPV